MNDFVFIINAGSSSIKFALYRLDFDEALTKNACGHFEGIGTQPRFLVTDENGQTLETKPIDTQQVLNHDQAITIILTWLKPYLKSGRLLAIGHRVVHGGEYYIAPVLINQRVISDLEKLSPLAPLHQPHNIAPMRSLLAILPNVPQVACFDTAFHSSQANLVTQFALPKHFTGKGIRRYGFHGLSYEYIASLIPIVDPNLTNARIIVAHLGNGASLCAMKNGISIATTMGFSPLDGLVMGTRCGNIDPGVIIYLMTQCGMTVQELEKLLYYQSGLLGVSGISGDMRVLLNSTAPAAQQAIDLFIYRVKREMGSLIAALEGLDAIIFTGGIGENAALIREKICLTTAWLGLNLNKTANETHNLCISNPDSKISAWIVPTDENIIIARHTLDMITY